MGVYTALNAMQSQLYPYIESFSLLQAYENDFSAIVNPPFLDFINTSKWMDSIRPILNLTNTFNDAYQNTTLMQSILKLAGALPNTLLHSYNFGSTIEESIDFSSKFSAFVDRYVEEFDTPNEDQKDNTNNIEFQILF